MAFYFTQDPFISTMACDSDMKWNAGSLDAGDKQNVRLLVQGVITLAVPMGVAPSSQRKRERKWKEWK